MWLVGGVDPMPLCSAWSPAKREAPWSKGDTSGVSANDTLMLKSVKGTNAQAEKLSFGKEKWSYLGSERGQVVEAGGVNAKAKIGIGIACQISSVKVVHAPCRSTIVSWYRAVGLYPCKLVLRKARMCPEPKGPLPGRTWSATGLWCSVFQNVGRH
ncbi:hypothetical protein TIFTF001_012620 [Ficus carica]|uniref:Uncharacterized protein n=1 Tax=Ficus carica TaxID=3494 RepID=A0AA88D6F9_FICCA|nr:hypothetical protein TIFTF001_012620 [Ficus carica]